MSEVILCKGDINRLMQSGALVDLYKLLGCYRVNFHPFEDTLTEEETDLYKQIMNGSLEEVTGQASDFQTFAESIYSTVYRGWRWYFETPQQLKRFCDILED